VPVCWVGFPPQWPTEAAPFWTAPQQTEGSPVAENTCGSGSSLVFERSRQRIQMVAKSHARYMDCMLSWPPKYRCDASSLASVAPSLGAAVHVFLGKAPSSWPKPCFLRILFGAIITAGTPHETVHPWWKGGVEDLATPGTPVKKMRIEQSSMRSG
jgi:hypothetical protein